MRVAVVLAAAAAPASAAPASKWYELRKSFSAITVGIAFEDDMTGWTSHTDGASLPQIVKTVDGGVSWAEVKNNTFKYHALVMGAAAKKTSAASTVHDIGVTGVAASEYSTDGDKWEASLPVIASVVSQDITYNMNADRLLITGGKGPCVGTVNGALYTCHAAGFQSAARYSSSPSKDVIYTTGGQWPSDNVRGSDGLVARPHGGSHYPISRNVRVVASDAGRRVELGPGPLTAADGDYVAELFKSEDGGKTWDELFHDEGNFYFNGIDCIDETNCIAVGEGFGESGGTTGARVYRTTDGRAFKLIHTESTLGTESLMTAKMLSATEFWVGGTTKTGGLLAKMLALHTTDGGATWVNEGADITGEAIMSWDWLAPDLAYATTVNAMQVSSLLKYTTTKPPPPPPPPAPPAPVPPGSARFHCDKAATQCVVAVDGHGNVSTCLTACTSTVPPDAVRYHCNAAKGVCIAATAGHSSVATCLAACQSAPRPPGPVPSGNFEQVDCSDSNCTAGCQSHAFPIGQCLQVTGGGSAEIASCDANGLVQNIYTSTDCTGTPQTKTAEVGQCLKASSGDGYFENLCDNSARALAQSATLFV